MVAKVILTPKLYPRLRGSAIAGPKEELVIYGLPSCSPQVSSQFRLGDGRGGGVRGRKSTLMAVLTSCLYSSTSCARSSSLGMLNRVIRSTVTILKCYGGNRPTVAKLTLVAIDCDICA